ncbi:Fanconi anemia group I protein [Toxorhynchites rutilus septentrionalis]|uniref:Fanconi anemia group I protein n=1 Tax=Toxorhynchites rutilus septentrionalis TaxID=329112 RepID=UPI00247A0AB4|nr:Fanconi anemia group I protein [Toxorhynchites rutilus septentrionalis]
MLYQLICPEADFEIFDLFVRVNTFFFNFHLLSPRLFFKMPPNLNVATAIIRLGQQKKNDELKEILEKIPTKELTNLITANINTSDGFTLWHFVLIGLTYSSKSSEKRFQVTMAVLQYLNQNEMSTKAVFDIISRLVLDLPKYSPEQLVEIMEYCVESIRAGDPKCMGWKDLLPDVLRLLSEQVGHFSANGFVMNGVEYRKKVLDDLFKMRIHNGILTSFTGMFRDVQLSKDEVTKLVRKVCDAIRSFQPLEIPALSFQLFHVCLKYSSLLVLPIHALQQYFHKHYFKKLLSNDGCDSTDFDSIEPVSDKEIREAEETILYHLSNITEFRLDEAQVVAMFKPFQNMAEFLLTPFVISAMIAMSRINRTPDTMKVVSSQVMTFLAKTVAGNENEKQSCTRSAWFRGRIEPGGVPNLDRILAILTEHSQEGMEVVTPGVIHFGFALLIAKKQPKLHIIAISFLQNFIKKRFIFGSGVVGKLKQYLLAELEATQFTECLITLSLTNALTLSECGTSINYILEYLLLIDGYHAMRIMTFLFPLIRISHTIRDSFIEVLRKAMYHSEINTRMMGVFGFCSLLKQLKNNNSRRSVLGGFAGNLTQLSISGMSLLSQSTLGRADNPDVHFDMLTLEILGILRRCFTQTVEVRDLLYESLGRAVEFNNKLLPHVLQFIDWHFCNYFSESLEGELQIDFEKCVRYKQDDSEDMNEDDRQQQVDIFDNVGKLMVFMVHCVTLCDQFDVQHDNDNVKRILKDVVQNIENISLDSLGIIGTLDPKTCTIGCHYLNTIEAGMSYCIWNTNSSNSYLRDLIKLFKYHQSCFEKIKKMEPKKSGKKVNDDTIASTAGGTSPKSVVLRPQTVLDLATVQRLLRIVFEESNSYATEEELNHLRTEKDFIQFVLKVASQQLELLRSTPEYWQIKHSKRIFGHLSECGKIVYDRCVKKTNELFGEGNMLVAQSAVECFKQSLLSALAVYERKFSDFLRLISCTFGTTFKTDLLKSLHEIVDKYFEDGAELESIGEKTIVNLFLCLEILYQSSAIEVENLDLAYTWMQGFCSQVKIKQKSLGVVHRILFDLRLRTQTGAYFDTVSMLIEKKFGQIAEEEVAPSFTLKSINSVTVESALFALCNVTNQELDDVEHFILRTNSILGRLKIYGHGENDEYLHQLKSIERSMCSQLVYIMSVATHLANTQLPLGPCMDSLLKLLINIYSCLTNFTKHFLTRDSVSAVSHDSTKFNLVVKSSKPLAAKIYDLFPFIEENVLGQTEEQNEDDETGENQKTKPANNSKRNREKVLRQTKFIPKLVFRIEMFNKFVLLLSKKTKKDLTHLLHMGTVRDFRIKEPALVEAIKKAYDGRSNETNSEFGDLADLEVPEDDDDRLTRPTVSSLVGGTPSVGIEESQLDDPENNTELSDIGDENQALINLALLNERNKRKSAKKRALTDEVTGNATVGAGQQIKKRKMVKKKDDSPRINKRALELANEVQSLAPTTSKTLGPSRRGSKRPQSKD